MGETKPQVLAGAQLHVTPAFAESPLTTAAMAVDALGDKDAGAAVNDTVIPEAEIVIGDVLALLVVSVTEVAVMTTVEEGAVAGAV